MLRKTGHRGNAPISYYCPNCDSNFDWNTWTEYYEDVTARKSKVEELTPSRKKEVPFNPSFRRKKDES